jgi:hypothetical protein
MEAKYDGYRGQANMATQVTIRSSEFGDKLLPERIYLSSLMMKVPDHVYVLG